MKKQKIRNIFLFLITFTVFILAMPNLLFAVTGVLKKSVKAQEIPGAELTIKTSKGKKCTLIEPPKTDKFLGPISDQDSSLANVKNDEPSLNNAIKLCDKRQAELRARQRLASLRYFWFLYQAQYFNKRSPNVNMAHLWFIQNLYIVIRIAQFQALRAVLLTNLQAIAISLGGNGGGGNKCFHGDTMVLLADGTTMKISVIKKGAMIKSYNSMNNTLEDKKVTKLYTFFAKDYYLINDSLKVTSKHPFLVSGTKDVWKKASELKKGDKIQSAGSEIIIQSIRTMDENSLSYNFEVKDSNNYIVGAENKYYVVHDGL